jgi:hypothetical protein
MPQGRPEDYKKMAKKAGPSMTERVGKRNAPKNPKMDAKKEALIRRAMEMAGKSNEK